MVAGTVGRIEVADIVVVVGTAGQTAVVDTVGRTVAGTAVVETAAVDTVGKYHAGRIAEQVERCTVGMTDKFAHKP